MPRTLPIRAPILALLVPLLWQGACSRGPDPLAAAPDAQPERAGTALDAAPLEAGRQAVRDDSTEAFGPWVGPLAPPLEAALAAEPATAAADPSAADQRLDLVAEDLLRRAFRAEREVARVGREREALRAAQDPLADALDAEYRDAVKEWNDLSPQISEAQALEHLAWIPRTAPAGTTNFAVLYRTDSLEDLYLENLVLDRSWAARTDELIAGRFAAGLYEVSALPSSPER